MKKLMNIFVAALVMLAAVGCEKNETFPDNNSLGKTITLTATINNGGTKTSLGALENEKYPVLWSAGDEIAVINDGTLFQFTLQDGAGTTSGTFECTSASGFDATKPIQAFYPYDGVTYDATTGTTSYTVPATQTYQTSTVGETACSSFGQGAMPMAAYASNGDTKLQFHNLFGALKLQLKGTHKVVSITIQGKGNEKLSGTADIVITSETNPSITINSTDASAKAVTLNCGEGVQLNESNATEFIIALPPVDFTSGFSVTITDIEAGVQIIETTSKNTVSCSNLLKMPEVTFTPTVENLSATETANCYIVSQAGSYRFTPTKGNSNESIGTISRVELLWETFGTDVTPNVGDLIKMVTYKDDCITFATADTFKEGNAVIAAKDANGKILWSWHIWLTDMPQGQVYQNNAGTMMDRNLGATSATPGDVGALGLLYQWGRKDPFLGSSSISSSTVAKSTISWPEKRSSNSERGTIDFVTANPTTFVTHNGNNYDWLYSTSSVNDNTRWQSSKTIYDPCPPGWRVSEGGGTSSGVWSKALGSFSYFTDTSLYDNDKKSINFTDKFGGTNIWYPTSGYLYRDDGTLKEVGGESYYWSVTTISGEVYILLFRNDGYVNPYAKYTRAYGLSVRCLKVNQSQE